MNIIELLKKHGIPVPDGKAEALSAEFESKLKSTNKFADHAQELSAKEAEIPGLKTQIKERDGDIKALKDQQGNSEELNLKLTALQTKYNTDTEHLTQQLEDLKLDSAVEKFLSPVPFASALARKAAIAEFKTKGFKLDGGKFQGGDAFIAELKQSDPAAFRPEETPRGDASGPSAQQEASPQFTRPISQPSAGAQGNPFSFQFSSYVRPPDSGVQK